MILAIEAIVYSKYRDMSPYLIAALVFMLFAAEASTATGKREKRELPLSYNCNPYHPGSCQKGDLISTSVADCEKDSFIVTCDPINNRFFSSVVDIPDVSRYGVNCVSKKGNCGSAGSDTRCVCYKAVDVDGPFSNQCRCQYWPAVDIRMNQPSYCTQYDHGGQSSLHFFTCCDNSNDMNDQTCVGTTYQGGGSTDSYCGQNGLSNPSGGGRITYRFNCGNCDNQDACKSRCDKNWLSKNIPGLCPKYSACFRGCCAQKGSARGKRQIDSMQFCGDFTCQSGENSTNCPVDCCPVTNPTDCNADTCSPGCCLEPHCCVNGGTSGSNALKSLVYLPVLLLLMTLCAIHN
ncbi:uncharacterized protein LOC135336562 [Halichondria panicea]|uniref:uncharacterized protein LOC135336562 n=1 Tax=Halichondria panicea TaxID=6063 RepID=UPI00312BC8F7